MLASSLLALAATLSTAAAQYKGFNYGSSFTDGTAKAQSDFENEFTTAQGLVGNSGFTSARLYTMIQSGTTNTPISAIPAAISTKTTLLLGLWASAGQDNFNNELAALSSAISQYGTAFTSLIAGISVGSEDLYRITPTGVLSMAGTGAEPSDLVNYISQVRNVIKNTAASGAPVGHVDTWTAYVNSSNDAVINAVDFIGMDAYPYFQNTMANSISNAKSLFYSAYDQVQAVSAGKPIWVTETGWPVSGSTENEGVPGLDNAKTYWDEVGCSLFGATNTWWYTLQDAAPGTPSPSFGIVGSTLSTTPLFDLTCAAGSSASAAASSAATVADEASTASHAASVSSVAPPAGDSGSAASQAVSNAPLPGASYDASATHAASSAAASGNAGSAAAGSSGTAAAGSAAAGSSGTAAAGSVAAGSSGAATAAGSAPAISAAASATTSPYASASAAASNDETTTVLMTEYTTDCPPVVVTSTITMDSDTTFATMTIKPTSAAAASSSACPANLSGSYQYPHLIVPVDKSQPDTAFGTSYNGTVSSTVSSLFNFDIPQSYAGKTCSLVFLLPQMSQLETSAYTLSGSGGISVNQLSSAATQKTTYDTVPSSSASYGVSSVTPGSSYIVTTGSCAAGQTLSYEVGATGSLALNYFQDYNPSPIGLYITAC